MMMLQTKKRGGQTVAGRSNSGVFAPPSPEPEIQHNCLGVLVPVQELHIISEPCIAMA